jgi:Protein of unknown function (DUF2491)
MSFKDAFKYATNILKQDEQPQSTPIPMQAKVGSLLRIEQTPFIRAQTGGSIVATPNELTEDIIQAIGRVKLGGVGDLYRFFIATQENQECDKFLQIFQNPQSEIVELNYFSTLTRIIPNEDEQAIFTGRNGVGLGELEYKLHREQLTSFGIAESTINSAVDADGFIAYKREGSTAIDFVAPTHSKETRIEDVDGVNGLSQELFFTSYSRQTNFGKEILLIETHIINSEDGDSTKRSIYVDFYIGIPIEAHRIKLQ